MKIPDNMPLRILQYRARHSIGQREFARRCGLTVQTVGNVENRVRPTASQMTLMKIEMVLAEDRKEQST